MKASGFDIVEVSELPPPLDLSPEEIVALSDDLVAYHAEFSELYYRQEQVHWGYKYLQGLLLPIACKAIQPMAQSLEGGNIQAMQQFIGQGQWYDQRLLHKHWSLVDASLGEEDGVLIIDSSGFPKRGDHSTGVARQWCGRLGKVENCQVGVFAGYASSQGYTLLDRRLYLPEHWFDEDHQQHREECGVPEELSFRTQPQLGLAMIADMVSEDTLRMRWVTCDEGFGKDPAFLDGITELGLWYMAEVPHSTRVWRRRPKTAVPPWSGHGRRPTKLRVVEGEPAAQRVDEIAEQIPSDQWQAYLVKEGSKGPLVAQCAFLRVVCVRDGLPGSEQWLVLRRGSEPDAELKTYLCNAPVEVSQSELVRIVGMRWPVETAIQDGKEGLGMDDYMVRTWLGWHHHMTLCILAHHYLVRVQKRLKGGHRR
jgi:SRSO17 transposase